MNDSNLINSCLGSEMSFSYHAISWHRHVKVLGCGGVAPSSLMSSRKI